MTNLVNDGSIRRVGDKIVLTLDEDAVLWLTDHLPRNDEFTKRLLHYWSELYDEQQS